MALQPHQQPHFQMSWQPSLLNPKRKTGPPLGLRNLGNSCYLNSVLQCLTYTPPLANFCLRSLHSSCCDSSADAERKRDCPFCILEKRIARSLKGDLAQDAPAKIQSCLRLFAEHFRCGRQEDAHEFLRYVIDACHNTCLRLKKLRQQQRKGSEAQSNGGNTIVKEIFGGALQSQVKCSSCGAESNKIDEIMDISLDIMYSSSLKDAMHKFFQPEVLDGNNKYKCENCKKLVVATKQMSVFQAPNILVIQLKRFEGIYGGKIDKMISFQEVLVLSGFMCKASQDPSPEYNLFGTIVHAGCSPDSGHYYSYIKDAMGRWYCCNDAFVSVATLEDVLSEKVYMLFFSRTKQRPVNTGHALSGVKSRDCTGNDTSKNDASASPPSKHIRSKPHVEGSPWQVISKSDKVPSGSRMKFSMVGNNGEKRVPSISNGKVDPSKVQLNRKKGESRDPIHAIKTEKHVATSSNGTCCGKENELDLAESKENQAIAIANNYRKDNENDAKKSQAFASENGNGHFINGGLNSVKSVLCESNGTRSKEANGRGSPPLKLQNGSINGPQNGSINGQRDTSGAKRKLQDGGCVLLDQDAESRVQVEELKELLKSKVALELRTCGWLDEVQTFMRLKKRSYAGKLGHTSENADACKQRLIEDAKAVKPTFASRIPESLKQELINDLQSFSQGKG